MSQAIVNPLVLTRQLQGWRASDDEAAYRRLAEALKRPVRDARLVTTGPGARPSGSPGRAAGITDRSHGRRIQDYQAH